jgi:hypothetical protein
MIDSNVLRQFVDKYHLEVEGVKFWTPYYMGPRRTKENPKPLGGPFKGKGTPEEILEYLKQDLAAKKLKLSSGEEYRKHMRQIELGIDCSGFIFYVIDSCLSRYGLKFADYLYKTRQTMIDVYQDPIKTPPEGLSLAQVLNYPDKVSLSQIQTDWGNEPRKLAGMKVLVNELAGRRLGRLEELSVGDLITMIGNDGIAHAVMVIELKENVIYYAHSGGSHGVAGYYGGVEYGEITVANPELPIQNQQWKNDLILKTHYFEAKPLYRLTVMDKIGQKIAAS